MRTKGRKLRNSTLNTRKKKKIKVNGEPFEIPTPSEQEATYSFMVDEERFPVWIQCIILRYWADLQHTFDNLRGPILLCTKATNAPNVNSTDLEITM